jgi:hypothetical protein
MSDAFERAAERAEAEDRRRHRERVGRGHRLAFRIHATVFVAVQVLLVVVWALVGAGYPWFLYALVGWGVGLAAHYAVVRDNLRPERAPPAD